jgi:hypothetical protein
MRLFGFPLAIIALAGLAGCDRAPGPGPGAHHGGRYLGIGTYPAPRLWSRMTGAAAPADPAKATIADDEQIIVTVDSQTGEVRQCGNLSGHCVASNPWQSGPGSGVNLSAHAAELDAVSNEAAPAPVRRP